MHSGRDPKESEGGTGKAEDAKLPGAGISPKPCPRKCAQEKGEYQAQRNRREEKIPIKNRGVRTFEESGFWKAGQLFVSVPNRDFRCPASGLPAGVEKIVSQRFSDGCARSRLAPGSDGSYLVPFRAISIVTD
jgi:hypothetical protein